MSHTDLVGLSDRDLKMRAGDATHQHFKGGLYKLLGTAHDADTGEPLISSEDGETVMLAYEHCYPHERKIWVRKSTEFHDWKKDPNNPDREVRRFRRLR